VIVNQGASKLVPVGSVSPHPRNVNQGDLGAILQSIERNGFFGALVVQKSTGHVLVGNHRLAAAREMGMEKVPAFFVDVSDEEALRILLADNRTARLGLDDDAALAAVLQELAQGDGLEGTGYDGDDLDDLLKRLGQDEDDFIQRQRDGDGGGYSEQYGVIVVCDDEEHQAKVYEQLQAQGLSCKVVVT
jgi:ParB-like chromosome segregation protein Spo0J